MHTDRETVVTGIDVPVADLVRFFLKAWVAWLIASLVIAVPIGIVALLIWNP